MLNRVLPAANRELNQWRESSLAPLGVPEFRAIWLASLASNLGAVIQTVGASWLMTQIGRDATSVALVQTAALAPVMLFALGAGALADIADRRKVMIVAQSLGLLASAALATLALMNMLSPLVLLVFTFLIGAGAAFHMPSWQASIGELVPRTMLGAAVAINVMAMNIARSVGPALGGLVLALAGAPAAFVINALSFAGLIFVLTRWHPVREPPPLPPEPIGAAMLTGVRYVGLSPHLIALLVRGSLFGIGGSAVWSLMPLIARDLLGGGPLVYGGLLASFGAGSLVAAMVTAYARARFGNERLVAFGFLGFALAAIAVGLSGSLIVALVFMALAGACWIFTLATLSVCIQLSTPRWVVGRAVSMSQVANVGGIAVGAVIWGLVAHRIGLGPALAVSGVFIALAALAGRWLPLPDTDAMDPSPWRGGPGRMTQGVTVDAQTGPIAVTVEYRVRIADAAAFLAAMHELGRLRVRDGARRWRVHQDLDDREIWREQFESPTWLAHLRLPTRITVSDMAVRERVRSFHIGEAPPIIRRLVERPPGSDPLSDEN